MSETFSAQRPGELWERLQRLVVERAAEESLKAARENRDDDYLDQLDAAVKRVVVAGDHLDFDAHLADQISIQDMWDLYEQALAAQRLRRDQMGKSESPSPSVTEQSVPNAAAADASTSPAQPNPSSSPA